MVKEQDYLGSYRLLKLVGTGRKCQVWDTMHDAKAERRACKIVLPQYQTEKEQLAIMRQEHTVAKDFKHANVIHIFEFNVDKQVPFIAMEYFDSINLKQLLQQTGEPLQTRLPKIIQQAAAGLGYVHEHDWIHRDIKPDNFLIGPDDAVKLIDFGLAERKRGAISRLFGGKSKIQGTRSYMSPEQVRGQPLDQRADIYSFGCMVFELLGGRPPFTGANTNELLNKHLRTPPPSLEAMNKNVSTPFANLIKKTLAKDKDDRPQSMAEFQVEMNAAKVFKTQPAERK